MKKLLNRRSKKIGLPPGTPVHIGEKKTDTVKITSVRYSNHEIFIDEHAVVSECFPLMKDPAVTWINIDGLHEVPIIEEAGKLAGIHPLTIEDILNTEQHPKIDFFDDYVYVEMPIITLTEKTEPICIEQLSIILGKNYVFTFREKESEIFRPLINRLVHDKTLIRKMGADYLAYALMDIVVDNYFAIIERLGDNVDEVEDEVLRTTAPEILSKIHTLRCGFVRLRKSVWPMREIVNTLLREQSGLIGEASKVYLKDLYDHVIQVNYTLETYRDIIYGLHDIYLTNLNTKMNEIMKFLTMVGTIFIPLTFVTSVYGMNFEYMPELKWHWGYFTVLVCMSTVAVSFVVLFKRKKWL
ncbi:MAG: magnesium/cobalt transporter CorA [Nitrospirae bacterium]|nr:magnesium/cobalt transporter CorA [Nitrospirota bacterium]